MADKTNLVQFTATPGLKVWRHADGGTVFRKHGSHYTTLVEAPVILKDGDRVKMSDADLAWCRATYPSNFSAVSGGESET